MLGLRAVAGSVAPIDQGAITIVPGLGALAGAGAAIDECPVAIVLGLRTLDRPGLAVVGRPPAVERGVASSEDGRGDRWRSAAQQRLRPLGGTVAALCGLVPPLGGTVALAGRFVALAGDLVAGGGGPIALVGQVVPLARVAIALVAGVVALLGDLVAVVAGVVALVRRVVSPLAGVVWPSRSISVASIDFGLFRTIRVGHGGPPGVIGGADADGLVRPASVCSRRHPFQSERVSPPGRPGDQARVGYSRAVVTRDMIGVNLVGYLNSVVGLGESARQFAGALRTAGVPHAVAAIEPGSGVPRIKETHVRWLGDAVLPYDVTVLWCNPDRYGIDVDPAALCGDRIIARWAWELPELPVGWSAASAAFCEIWTASRFVARAVAASVAVPVRVIPQPVVVPRASPLDRARWRVPVDHALFVFMFDHHSTMERKNPLGLLAAFTAAYPPGRGATLIIKTINAANVPAAAGELVDAARSHPDVHVVDVALPASERASLIAGCDCYVSLHRSEGFGMTIAEAMGHARPVIATGFGGNVDFIDDETGYLVRSQPKAVGEGVPIYPSDGVWAEPDLLHAAELMRAVCADPVAAAARGQRAAARIATVYSPAATGASIARVLTSLSGT